MRLKRKVSPGSSALPIRSSGSSFQSCALVGLSLSLYLTFLIVRGYYANVRD